MIVSACFCGLNYRTFWMTKRLVLVFLNPASIAKNKGLVDAGVLLMMAEAARELEDSDWVLELHSVASRGTGATRHIWQDVVRVLTKSGRLDEAARVLQVKTGGSV